MPPPNASDAENNQAQADASGFGDLANSPPGDAAPDGADSSSPGHEAPSGEQGEIEVPEAYRAEDGTLDPAKALAKLTELETSTASRVEKYGEVPEADYDLALPEDLKGPDGAPLKVDPENEILKSVLPLMKEMGIGQKGATQLLSAYANAVLKDTAAIAEEVTASVAESTKQAMAAEFESLGEKRVERYSAMVDGVAAALAKEGADGKSVADADAAKALVGGIRTKAGFEALERLLAKRDPSQENRVPAGSTPGGKESAVSILYPKQGAA